jgi:protein O-mannosyl-transferase
MPRKSSINNSPRFPWLRSLLIFSLALLPYLGTVAYDFTFDDGVIVARNPAVQEWGQWKLIFWSDYWPGTHSSLYRPLTILSFSLEKLFHGPDPAGFHFVNIILHAAASVLVYLIAVQLMGATWGAVLAGSLFALHPIHIEVVSGVVGRAELLSTLLGLGSLYIVMRRQESWAIAKTSYIWALILFFMALNAKENAIVIPALVALWLISRQRTRTNLLGSLKVLLSPGFLGFLGTALFYVFLRTMVLGGIAASLNPNPPFVENPLGSRPAVVRIITALANQGRGLLLNFFPWPLRADYSYQTLPSPSAGFSLHLLIMLIAIGASLTLWIVRKHRAKDLAFASSWYLVAVLPASNIFFVAGTLFAERLFYLPSVGFSLALALLLDRAMESFSSNGLFPRDLSVRILLGAAAVVLLGFTGLILLHSPVWKDDLALFTDTVENAPFNVKARLWLGDALVRSGDFAAGLTQYRKALEIYPEYAAATANIVVPLTRLHRTQEAIEYGEKARGLFQGENPVILFNLALAYLDAGNPVRFLEYIREVIRLDPRNTSARYQLGLYYWQQEGNRELAGQLFQEVFRLDPTGPDAQNIRRRFPELRYD